MKYDKTNFKVSRLIKIIKIKLKGNMGTKLKAPKSALILIISTFFIKNNNKHSNQSWKEKFQFSFLWEIFRIATIEFNERHRWVVNVQHGIWKQSSHLNLWDLIFSDGVNIIPDTDVIVCTPRKHGEGDGETSTVW